ncbi:uncharacterized protein LOC111337554 [Stylophora pistillata]|uniref:uncharacterized protein LOC111337554 n=1 Tax=Stylophora pistillata TaxID=50429 RepID=UPI000C03F7DA|nr:uncharacterized protein LOC111337554 [Stylophora pistillata]
MAYKGSRLCTLQDVQDIWRPCTSQVDCQHKVYLKTVTVAFDRNKIFEVPHSPSKCRPIEHTLAKETEASKMDYYASMTAPSDYRQTANNYRDYVTPTSACALDDTRSVLSNSEASLDRVPRTNILSRMAKTKASWVENQKIHESLPHRKSPILCKGSPVGGLPQTPYTEKTLSTDRATKGVRDGKKFDLLPISKYLAHYRDERNFRMEKLPLVRISSYHTLCGCLDGLGSWDCPQQEYEKEKRQTATFFTTKDVFKPFHSRLLPTRGEVLYVEPAQTKLNSYFTDHVKLPSLQGNSRNDTFVTEFTERSKASYSRFKLKGNTTFPVIVH